MSIATATWTCLWVSTPTITFRASGWIVLWFRHRVASSGAGASAGWADRTVMSRRCSRPLWGHCPSGQDGLPCQSPTDDDRQFSSQDRRSVNLWVRPSPTGTHQCHSMTPTGIGMMLTVRLRRRVAE